MMTRKLMFLISLLQIGGLAFSQEVKKETDAVKTKMDVFVSKTGVITKFIDIKLSNIKTPYGSATTRVRKIMSGSVSGYFYQIVKGGTYGEKAASIEYTDLLEVIKALKVLKSEADKDIAAKPEYLENRFITEDGFEVAYFISNEKITWCIKLEKYGSDNTLFLKSGDDIEAPFNEARNKIDELKKGPE